MQSFCSALGMRKAAQQVYFYPNVCHSFCSCWVNIQIFGISVVWKPGTAGGEIEKKNQSTPACLSDWHSRAESESESNFICLLSGPHVSWPMTYHLVAVILRQWCCDLALPQSHNPLLTSSCMGLCLGMEKKRRQKEKLTSFLHFFPNCSILKNTMKLYALLNTLIYSLATKESH